ncbi:SUKH-4 family immunity protein [Streptomyces ginkgonis]|uniref:SUKH-4 family immunity protein n=1 Tax=Streptomyces ginkgonis TaxID=1812259 RepID=UPI002176ECE2|nr:SUKH-4 family immunity protein [Streptomyces ginkgonis]
MVTFAQAQERADRWVNGSATGERSREVRVREFDLGFVAWAEDCGGKLVIARDSGESTLWPALPVSEVIRRYEEAYGGSQSAPVPAAEPPRIDVEATSFLLTPPDWLKEAADRANAEAEAKAEARAAAEAEAEPVPEPVAASAAAPEPEPEAAPEPVAAPVAAADPEPDPDPWAGTDTGGPPSSGGSVWDATDTSGSGTDIPSVAPPATVFSPPVVLDREPPAGLGGTGGGAEPPAQPASEARTSVMPQGSALPKTQLHDALPPAATPPPGLPPVPPAPALPGGTPGGAADLASADTAKAAMAPTAPQGGPPPAPPGLPLPPPPPAPGAPPAPGTSGGGSDAYIPTQQVSPEEIAALKAAASRPTEPNPSVPPPGSIGGIGGVGSGNVHAAATMLSPAPGTPGAQGTPGAPAAPGAGDTGGVPFPPPAPAGPGHGTPPPPPPGPAIQAPGGPGTPPPPAQHGPPSQGYGYPPPGMPTVGSGYMAVLRYRAPDGSEQQLIRRSAPGMPHPEWQLLHELHAMNVPPQQVLELHTELQSCELPGGYCARMIRDNWPQVRITHTASYGHDHATRQAGVRHLVEHQDELQQFADGPPRSAPVRAPLPQQQPAPAVGLDVIGQELAEAYGPQAVFRYDQQSVSRQGVPEIVAHTLLWAGLPLEIAPLFWAYAQPGRLVPTLAEVAAERGVQPAPDAGSYLVMGTDFGKQLCVQYGTAHIVAVPLEAGPGGAPVAPQFVNASLPQFVRCLALLGRMWRLRYGLNPEQAGRWTTDFQAQLASLDPQAVADPENWWSVLLEQMWDGLL